MSTATRTDDSSSNSPDSPMLGNNAPKFGTLVPNRIFVGGIHSNTTETELYEFFAQFGNVTETKIIADRAGVSKGYGFVTYETEEEAHLVQKEENLVMKDHKLNIAPAIRKQGFTRTYSSADSCSSGERPMGPRHTRNVCDYSNYVTSPTVADPTQGAPSGTVYFQTPTQYGYPNNYVYAASDPSYSQHQAYYPMMYPSTVYIPQPYYQSQSVNPSQWGGQPTRWATHLSYAQSASPQSNGNSPAMSTISPSAASPYAYSSATNGGLCASTTCTSPCTTSCTTSASTTTTATTGSSGSAADSATPTGSYSASSGLAIYCPYPPPSPHGYAPYGYASYQPTYGVGAGDLMDAVTLEANGAEIPAQLQVYGGGSHSGGRGFYQPARGRGGQSYGSPRKSTLYAMQRQSFPRYPSPQQHYRQPKHRHMGPPRHAILLPASAMGNMGDTSSMTPPPTPNDTQSPDGGSSNSNNTHVVEATSRFSALTL